MDWKRKLSSRKFWLAVANFVAMMLIAFGLAREVAVQIAAIIMAGGSIVAYILAEGWADAQGAGVPDYILPELQEVDPEIEDE